MLGHDPLRTSGPFAVREGIIDEYVHVASWSDQDAVRRLVKDVERGNDIVGVHASFEPTQRYAIELRARLGLPHNTAEDTLHVLDKAWVRRRLHAEGLSRLRHTTLSEALTWDTWRFDGPAVLKPCNGTASVLCFAVGSLDELRTPPRRPYGRRRSRTRSCTTTSPRTGSSCWRNARRASCSRSSRWSAEGVQHVGLTGRYLLAADPVVEQGLFFPYAHPRAAEIIEVCAAFHRSLNVVDGATHLEVMVPDSGPIELIDFNLRFSGIGAIALASDAFGVPFARYLADLACGRSPTCRGSSTCATPSTWPSCRRPE